MDKRKAEKLLAEARKRFDHGCTAEDDNRQEMEEDLAFLTGEGQWTEEAKTARKGRPTLTINRMPQFVRQVVNDVRQSRPSVKVHPVDSGADPDTAELFAGLIRNIEVQSEAQEAYNQAVENAASCGEGAFRIITEWSSDDLFNQDIKILPIRNPFAVTFDPTCIKKTGEDADWCFVTEQISKEQFEARYPKASQSDFGDVTVKGWARWWSGEQIRIAEYWYKKKEPALLALLQDGRTVDITELAPEEVQMLPIARMRKVEKDCIYRAIINGNEVLEDPVKWPGRYIPVIRVVGEEINMGERVVRHGVIRWSRDAQRMYNYWRSAQTEAIALQPKYPYIVDPRGVAKYKPYWDNAHNTALPYLPYSYESAKGAPPPTRMAPPAMSTGMANEIATAADDMKATTGIYDAALGARGNETSGKAILARQREADVSTFTYADNLGRAIKHCGRVLIDLIPKIYDTARIIRTMGEDEVAEMVPINQVMPNGRRINDLSVGRYDVTINVGPSYSTKRQEAAEGMLAAIQSNPQLWSIMGDLFAKNLDWPGADQMAERMKKMLPPGMNDDEKPRPPPPPNPAELIKLEQEKQKTMKLKAEADGQKLENMETQLDIAEKSGQMQQMITQAVQQAMMQMLAPRVMPPQGPM